MVRLVGVFLALLVAASLVVLMVIGAGARNAAEADPDGLDRLDIGESVEGRPIEVACRGAGGAVVLLIGGIHTGHEANTVDLVEALVDAVENGELEIPSGVRLCLLPNANPDGLALGFRTNANGVDLNRNWPAENWSSTAFHPATGTVSGGDEPLSEPETRALHDFIVETEPALAVSWHCCAALVEGNDVPPASEWARLFAEAAELDYVEEWTEYEITGGFIRALEEIDVPAMDVELVTEGAVPVARHLAAVEALLGEVAGSSRE